DPDRPNKLSARRQGVRRTRKRDAGHGERPANRISTQEVVHHNSVGRPAMTANHHRSNQPNDRQLAPPGADADGCAGVHPSSIAEPGRRGAASGSEASQLPRWKRRRFANGRDGGAAYHPGAASPPDPTPQSHPHARTALGSIEVFSYLDGPRDEIP